MPREKARTSVQLPRNHRRSGAKGNTRSDPEPQEHGADRYTVACGNSRDALQQCTTARFSRFHTTSLLAYGLHKEQQHAHRESSAENSARLGR